MKTALVFLAAILGVVMVSVVCLFSSRNSAIGLEEEVRTANSAVETHLSNRFNKLHELAACVKKYDEHEYSTLVKTIEARGRGMSGSEAKQCIAAFSRVEERYPELKSQKNYQFLMNDISITENRLAQAKRGYNESVRDYNYHCRKFPTSLFLSVTGYRVVKFEYYTAEDSVRDTKPLDLF